MASTLNADNGSLSGSSGLKGSGDASGVLALQTNGTTALTIDTSQNVGIGTTSPSAKLDIASGNLSFSGSAQRITGDFSNATIANRVAFQTSTTNGATALSVIPNGTNTVSLFRAYNNSDLTNGSYLTMQALSTEVSIQSSYGGTGSYLPMTFYTGGAERMRIDSSGNVGIGTSSPATRLDVLSSGTNAVKIVGAGSRTMYTYSDSGGIGWSTGSGVSYVNMFYMDSGNNLLQFFTNSSERMRIDSSGNVGIGISNPQALLHIQATSGLTPQIKCGSASSYQLQVGYNNSAEYGFLQAYAANLSTPDDIVINPSGGNLFLGTTSGNYQLTTLSTTYNAAKIGLMVVGRSSSEYPSSGYNVRFTSTSATYTYDNSDTAAWIRYGQNSGRIETFTAPIGTAGATISYTTGPYVAQGGTSWTNSSDERLKTDLVAIEDAANKVNLLRAVTGRFKTDPEDKRRAFVIAQDVQKVLPEAVDGSDPDKLGVQYTDLIPLLVAAIQEQQEQINQLKAEVDSLKAQLNK